MTHIRSRQWVGNSEQNAHSELHCNMIEALQISKQTNQTRRVNEEQSKMCANGIRRGNAYVYMYSLKVYIHT